MGESISFQIARASGLFQEDAKQFLSPDRNSDVAELFGHSKKHNRESYVLPANKPETVAYKCGGSEYTLAQFSSVLGYSPDDLKGGAIPSHVPLKKVETTPPQFHKQHSQQTPLEGLHSSWFKYFLEHGIEVFFVFIQYCIILNPSNSMEIKTETKLKSIS